jgi:hypothetical protein
MKAQWDKRLDNAGKTLESVLAKNEQTRQTIDAQLRPIERELGIPQPEVSRTVEDPVVKFQTYMQGSLDPPTFRRLHTMGLDAEKIVRLATSYGTTPEKYLNAIVETMNKPEKESQQSVQEKTRTYKQPTYVEIPEPIRKGFKSLFPTRGQY